MDYLNVIEYFLATIGPLRHLTIPFDQSPCDERKQHKLQKIKLPTKVYLINIYNF